MIGTEEIPVAGQQPTYQPHQQWKVEAVLENKTNGQIGLYRQPAIPTPGRYS